MKHKYWSILLCCLLAFAACTKNTKITGVIHQSPQQYAMLYKVLPQELAFVDTVLLIKGKFSYIIDNNEFTIYLLRFNDTSFASFALGQGEQVHITAKYPDINHSIDIQGNEETSLLLQSRTQLMNLDDKVKLLSNQFKNYSNNEQLDSINNCLMRSYDTLYQQHKLWLKNFILSNPNTLAALTAFYQNLGHNSFFSANDDRYLLDTLYQHLPVTYPTSLYVSDLKEKLGYDE